MAKIDTDEDENDHCKKIKPARKMQRAKENIDSDDNKEDKADDDCNKENNKKKEWNYSVVDDYREDYEKQGSRR